MKRSDLKFGMVVELRDGTRCIIVNHLDHTQNIVRLDDGFSQSGLFYYNEDLTNNVSGCTRDVVKVYKDYTLQNVLWERKELLTDEELDWLAAVIKPFRDKVKYVKKTCLIFNYNTFISIKLNDLIDNLTTPNISNMYLKFNGLEGNREYSLDELGL